MTKFRLILIGWLLCHTLSTAGWWLESTTFEWCVKYNKMPPDKVAQCANEFYHTPYITGRILQYNPVSHLRFYIESIIDRE